jgi:hypothetical protein
MKREDILKEMKDSIGTENPIDFFKKFVSLFDILFDKIEHMESTLKKVKTNSALSIQWEPKIASDMLTEELEKLREDKATYAAEITALKVAYAEGKVVQKYDTFCQFWLDTLGWHPFLDYK